MREIAADLWRERTHIFEVTAPDGGVQTKQFTTRRRYFLKPEIEKLFSGAGFIIEGSFEGYGNRPADDRSPQIMFELRLV